MLRPDQIEQLENFRRAAHDGAPHGYSLPQLRLAMDAKFGWETLKKALAGLPVWNLHYFYIVQWIAKYLPTPPAPIDGKAAASGERDEQDTETAGANGPIRRQG